MMCMLISCSIAVNEGDRIAQLILERIVTPDVVEVQVGIPAIDTTIAADAN